MQSSVLSPVTWSLPVLRWHPVTRILLSCLIREVHAFRVITYSPLIIGKPKGYISGDSYLFVPQWAGQDSDAALQLHFLQPDTMELSSGRSSFCTDGFVFLRQSRMWLRLASSLILCQRWRQTPDFPASTSWVLGYRWSLPHPDMQCWEY